MTGIDAVRPAGRLPLTVASADFHAVQTAWVARAAAWAVVQANEAKAATLDADEAEALNDIAALTTEEEQDAARRFLDGEHTAPPNPARLKKLAALRDRLVHIRAAKPLQLARKAESLAAFEAADTNYRELVVRQIHDERTAAAAAMPTILLETRPLLVRMVAADILQESILGRQFPYRGELALFNGTHVARAFISGLKARLRPPSLNEESIMAEASALAAEQLAQIQKEK
jgi:hypothetical protein